MNDGDGTSLSQRIAQGPLPAAETIGIARAFAEALRRLHESGVVHGALEPGCVILQGSGIVLQHGSAAHPTSYSAPEQVEGKPADARSDIFAFGAILYEMLSGRKAFARQGVEPAPLADAPAGLARLAFRCLAKNPGQRCQRAQNVQMELKLLGVMSRREDESGESPEQRLHALLRTELAQMEERIGARLSAIENSNAELRTRVADESQGLEDARHSARELRAAVEELSKHAADGAAGVAARLDTLDRTLTDHGSSIESLDTAITQTDDLIEHLVDEFDALERSLNGHKKTPAAMAALSK